MIFEFFLLFMQMNKTILHFHIKDLQMLLDKNIKKKKCF